MLKNPVFFERLLPRQAKFVARGVCSVVSCNEFCGSPARVRGSLGLCPQTRNPNSLVHVSFGAYPYHLLRHRQFAQQNQLSLKELRTLPDISLRDISIATL